MKRTLIIAIALVLGLVLTVTKANADVILAQGDAYYVGLVNDGIPPNPPNEVVYINTLTAQPANSGPTAVGTETYTRSSLAGPFPTAVLGGAVKDESVPPNSTFLSTGFLYILGKYDAAQAGSLVWYIPGGASGTVTLPSTLNGLGLSHISAYNPTSVPDGGVTLMLLGGALVGIETLRRRLSA